MIENKIFFTKMATEKLRILNRNNKTIIIGVRSGGCKGFIYSIEEIESHNFTEFKIQTEKNILYSHEDITIFINRKSIKFLLGKTISEELSNRFTVKQLDDLYELFDTYHSFVEKIN